MVEKVPTINRERLSVIVALILLSLAVIPLLDAPGQTFDTSVFGSELGFQITLATMVTLVAAALACAGVDLLIRTHPHVRNRKAGPTYVFWVLPALTVIAAAQWLSRASSGEAWVAQLFVVGIVVWIIVQAEFAAIDLDGPTAGRARLVLNIFAYALAFGLFALIWETRARSLITATLAAITALLISIDLIRASRENIRRVLIYSLAVGLVIGECAWALNYWRATTASAGLTLVLIFYTLSGIAMQHLFGKLTQRVLLEFGLVILIALVLVLLGTPR